MADSHNRRTEANERFPKNSGRERTDEEFAQDDLPSPDELRRRNGSTPGSGLPADIAFLANAGIDRCVLMQAAILAESKNIAASEILIARKEITRKQYLSRLAEHIGANYRDGELDPETIVLPEGSARPDVAGWSLPRIAHLEEGGNRCLVLTPAGGDAGRLVANLERFSNRLRSVILVEPHRLSAVLFTRLQGQFERQARSFLAARYPQFSASRRCSRGQRWVAAIACALLAAAFAAGPEIAMLGCAVAISLVYLIVILFRAWLIIRMERWQANDTWPGAVREACTEDYPVYSVLVALYREENQIRELITALDRLNWPKGKREIFLICESDDQDTISAIEAQKLPEGFRLVICPDCKPKTKPKALNFAIPLCSGEFLVIYDAEDRPHPDQLMEAWINFRRGDPTLGCLQAPLAVSNPQQSWLAAMFAIEYDTLFRGILPALENLMSVLPLGGTSNHFSGIMYQRHQGLWERI